MKILFLDQTAKIAGAELVLLDIAKFYKEQCLVFLFEDGPFKQLLQQNQIPVIALSSHPIQIRRESGFIQSLSSLNKFVPLIKEVTQQSCQYDLIYANTLKALVVGAMASILSRRPLVFHLHDILSKEHFSDVNRWVVVRLANQFASQVITVSQAAQKAFVMSGGRADRVEVVYNGFEPERYQGHESGRFQIRQQLGLGDRFTVGHFSRLSPWKGQHVLIEALVHCPDDVTAILAGDALFGEQEYVQQLHAQVAALGLQDRVQFLGFRSDVPQLMAICDLVAHTSTAPEPSARVLVETMLCGRPLAATQDGGTVELVEHGKTGWLIPPGDPEKLAEVIMFCRDQPEQAAAIAHQAQVAASQRFRMTTMTQQIESLLEQVVGQKVLTT